MISCILDVLMNLQNDFCPDADSTPAFLHCLLSLMETWSLKQKQRNWTLCFTRFNVYISLSELPVKKVPCAVLFNTNKLVCKHSVQFVVCIPQTKQSCWKYSQSLNSLHCLHLFTQFTLSFTHMHRGHFHIVLCARTRWPNQKHTHKIVFKGKAMVCPKEFFSLYMHIMVNMLS